MTQPTAAPFSALPLTPATLANLAQLGYVDPPTNGLTSIPPKPLPDLAGAKPVQVLYKTALHP
ncbi:hypothetical protein [Burkholderia sp. RS02]|uniref:hypothetical protein n=1 Tax=unclassified Burkholderia TaxID=2613784 RepID=UPI0032183876